MINLRASLIEDIREGVAAAIKAGDLPASAGGVNIVVDRPDREGQGDYASPVALALVKQAKKAPMDIVEAIAKHMPKKEYVGSMEAAAPGFLNIWISEEWLAARVNNIATEHVCDDMTTGRGQHVNLEFISANPTGPLTLGNVRTAFSVDTFANVLECAGYNVTREYYMNDAGGQILRLGESVLRRILQEKGEDVDFPEELYQGEYIQEVGRLIAEEWEETEGRQLVKDDLENTEVVRKVSEQAVHIMKNRIMKTVREDLHIRFDVWTSEQEIRNSGQIDDVLAKLKKEKKVYEKEGALWFKATDYGEEKDKVMVKADGEYAYFTPDIAYHQNKYDRQFDHIFTFLGADHVGQVPKMYAAMEALGNDKEKLHFVVAQWMALKRDGKTFKPSKRKGQVYGPQDLIEEIGYDAARFFMVQHNLSSHMELDLDLAKERSERNPVYYVQYAYVRLQSILRKAKEQGAVEAVGEAVPIEGDIMLTDSTELALVRTMFRLPEVMEVIATSFEVHSLAYYAHDLSRVIHQFYNEVPVLTVEDEGVLNSRLQLVFSARNVLGQTLDLLGISKPDVM